MRSLSLVVLGAMMVGVSTQPFSCFPRMRETPSIKPFEQRMPEMPAGVAPFGEEPALPSTPEAAAGTPNPIKRSAQAVDLGRIYYGYYCIMCHGAHGKGDGAVGESYVPRPADLTTAKVQAMPDGALCLGMVTGKGHEPVMAATVPLSRRWYIAHYLHALAPESRSRRSDVHVATRRNGSLRLFALRRRRRREVVGATFTSRPVATAVFASSPFVEDGGGKS